MTQEEFIKYTERMNKNIVSLLKGNEEELAFYSQLVISFNRICDEKYKMEDKINKAINFIVKETKLMPMNGCKIRIKELLDILKEK